MKKHFPNFYNWKERFTFSEKVVIMLVIMFAFIGLVHGFLS